MVFARKTKIQDPWLKNVVLGWNGQAVMFMPLLDVSRDGLCSAASREVRPKNYFQKKQLGKCTLRKGPQSAAHSDERLRSDGQKTAMLPPKCIEKHISVFDT